MVTEFGEESNTKNKDICYLACNTALINTCMYQKWYAITKVGIGTDRLDQTE